MKRKRHHTWDKMKKKYSLSLPGFGKRAKKHSIYIGKVSEKEMEIVKAIRKKAYEECIKHPERHLGNTPQEAMESRLITIEEN